MAILALRRRLADRPPRATFHHGPESTHSKKRPEIRMQSDLIAFVTVFCLCHAFQE